MNGVGGTYFGAKKVQDARSPYFEKNQKTQKCHLLVKIYLLSVNPIDQPGIEKCKKNILECWKIRGLLKRKKNENKVSPFPPIMVERDSLYFGVAGDLCLPLPVFTNKLEVDFHQKDDLQ